MQSGLDAKPTVEALEEERRRLKELERNLAAERDRVQAAAAEEIGQLQRALKEAAERAARREGELEAARKRLERKLQRGRLGRLARRVHARGQSSELSQVEREEALAEREAHLDERERTLRGLAELATAETARLRELGESLRENRAAVETVEALEVRARELTQREAELEHKVDELVDAERRSVEQLAARAAQLEAREQALAEDSEAAAAREPTVHPVRVAPVRGIVQGGQEEAAFADRLTVLGEREADLAESISALEQKERELALLREELETERGRLAERWRRLGEAEQVPGRTAVRLVRFSEGLRELARKRGVA